MATGAPDGPLPTGAAVAGAAPGPLVAGAGVATGGETGEVVTGVTTSFAVMKPLTFFFCFLPVVPRAFRVATLDTAATAFSSAVLGARALGGASPKMAKTSAEFPKVPRIVVSSASDHRALRRGLSTCGLYLRLRGGLRRLHGIPGVDEALQERRQSGDREGRTPHLELLAPVREVLVDPGDQLLHQGCLTVLS